MRRLQSQIGQMAALQAMVMGCSSSTTATPMSTTIHPTTQRRTATTANSSAASPYASGSSSSTHNTSPTPNINTATEPYVSETTYRPLFAAADVADLLVACGLWDAVEPLLMARAGCSTREELQKLIATATDSATVAAGGASASSSCSAYTFFTLFDDFAPLFSHYFTFEDRHYSAAGEVLLQHYVTEAVGDYCSYYNLVLSSASTKQIAAAAVNHYSLRLWAEDGCGLQRFLSAPPMLNSNVFGATTSSSATTSTTGSSSTGSNSSTTSPPPKVLGRLARHQQLRQLLDNLRDPSVDMTSLPALKSVLFSPPAAQPHKIHDLAGTTFVHSAASFAKGTLAVKLCHLIGVLEAEFGTDLALWFVNERFQLREVDTTAASKGNNDADEDPLGADDAASVTCRRIQYEVVELPRTTLVRGGGASSATAGRSPVLSSTLGGDDDVRGASLLTDDRISNNTNTTTSPPAFGLRIAVDWKGTVPNFIAVVAKQLSATLERYPATSVCEAILQAQGLGCEYVARSVLVPLPKEDASSRTAAEAAAADAFAADDGGVNKNADVGSSSEPSAKPVEVKTVDLERAFDEAEAAADEADVSQTATNTAPSGPPSAATVTAEAADADDLAQAMMMDETDDFNTATKTTVVEMESSHEAPNTSTNSTTTATTTSTTDEEDDVLDLIFSGATEVGLDSAAAEDNVAASSSATLTKNTSVDESATDVTTATASTTLQKAFRPDSQTAFHQPSALYSLAASPKPGVVDHIGKWVSRASQQMERQRAKSQQSLLAAGGGADADGIDMADVAGVDTPTDTTASLLNDKVAASDAHKFEVGDGWLATPEKAPAWTNKVDFFAAAANTNNANNSGYSSNQQQYQSGSGESAYLIPLAPKVVRLASDRFNVTGSFITHPHRRQSDRNGSFANGDAANSSPQTAAAAPFIFPEYYNSMTGKFDKDSGDKPHMWRGPNSDYKDGVAFTKARIWKVGEREAAKRREELLVAAAAKAQLHGVDGGNGNATSTESVTSTLAVLFGGVGYGSGFAAAAAENSAGSTPKASLLVGADASSGTDAVSYDGSLHIPKGMTMSAFMNTFTEPDEALSRDRIKNAKAVAAMQNVAVNAVADACVVAAAAPPPTTTTANTSATAANNHGHKNISLSEYLIAYNHMSNAPKKQQNMKNALRKAQQPKKSHQRWFEVSLVTFPADLPSVSSNNSHIWMRPRNSQATGDAANAADTSSTNNSVKVAVASTIAPQYTNARVEACRKYLMGLVMDMEQLASA